MGVATATLGNTTLTMTISRFFCPESHAFGNALINWTGRPVQDLVAYAESYRSAACRLVHAHRELRFNTLDHQALPILFLYRHSFELFLKAIVYYSATLSISDSEIGVALPRLWREHSLVRLHAMALPVLQEPHHSLLDAKQLGQNLCELAIAIDAVDNGSYSFRYPVTSSGTSSLPSHFLTNIFSFSEAVESLLDDSLIFCRGLGQDAMHSSRQMKLALHGLTTKNAF